MNHYPERESHIGDKDNVVLYLSKKLPKKLDHTIGVDTSDIATKKDVIYLNTEVGKPDINKLTNVSTSLNNSKRKVDDLDVGKLETVPVELKN